MTNRGASAGRSDEVMVTTPLPERLEELRLALRADLRRECNRVIFGMIPTYVALLGLVVTIAMLS